MRDDFVEVGDVVQVCPEIPTKKYAGCFVVVCDVKKFGVIGYIEISGDETLDVTLKWDQFEYVGKAVWLREEDY